MRKLAGRLKKECEKAEDIMERRLGHLVANTHDMLRFMVDGTDVHEKGHVYFAGLLFYKYYFVKEMWREARECFYYAETLGRINREKELKTIAPEFDYKYLIFFPEERRNRFLLGQFDGIEKKSYNFFDQKWDIQYLWFKRYWQSKGFAPEAAALDWALAHALAGWKGRIEENRIYALEQNMGRVSWAEQTYWMFDSLSRYLVLLMCAGRIDEIEPELQPYVEWLEWTRKNKTQARFMSETIHHYRETHPRIFIPTMQAWMAARREPQRCAKLAAEAFKGFNKWFIDEEFDAHFPTGLSNSILLSIVMRIDLGLDVENCREFAHYFMPYLAAFPHIAEKLEALNVEYEPPAGLMSQEEVAALKRQYQLDLGRDPETGVSVFQYYQKN